MSDISDSPKRWAVLIMDANHRILPEHTVYFCTKWGAKRYKNRLNLRVFTAKVVRND